jgi:hypothetical protein
MDGPESLLELLDDLLIRPGMVRQLSIPGTTSREREGRVDKKILEIKHLFLHIFSTPKDKRRIRRSMARAVRKYLPEQDPVRPHVGREGKLAKNNSL